LATYNEWLEGEKSKWSEQEQHQQSEVNSLLDIYHTVLKEVQRQRKMQGKRAYNSQKQINFKQIMFNEQPQEWVKPAVMSNSESQVIIKKVSMSKQTRTTHNKYFKTVTIKCSATETTKNQTKYDKLTLTNHSLGGLRGISMKYDLSNFQTDQGGEKEKKRQTEAFNRSGIKLTASNIFKKTPKRHQSAQKFRPQN
jgi:hypothetical protein